MAEVLVEDSEKSFIKQTRLGKNDKLRLFIFETLGTAILATGVCCTKYVAPISQKKENPFHDQFISLSLYLAIVICSPFALAHFNPSVSLAFFVRRQQNHRINSSTFSILLGSQMLGALIGTGFAQLIFGCGANSLGKQQTFLFILREFIGEMIGGFVFIFFIFMVTHPTTTFIVQSAWVKLFIPLVLFCARKDSFYVGGINPAVMLWMDLLRVFKGDSNGIGQFLDVVYVCLGSLVGGVLACLFFEKIYLKNVDKWKKESK